MKLAKYLNANRTPQDEAVPGTATVPNSAGGYVFAVNDWVRLDRFLVLGSEGGSYYATERKLTLENAEAVVRCAGENGAEAVRRIVAISDTGRAPKNDYAIFALALVAAKADALGKKAAYEAVGKVCRTGTHLFQFAAASNELRGWGRGLRQAVADWYLTKNLRDLAYQVTKYQQRDNWSHRDLLRLAHPKTDDAVRNDVLGWAAGKRDGVAFAEKLVTVEPKDALAPLYALEAAKRATNESEVVRLVRDFRLVREGVPTQFLTSTVVLESLLQQMPLTAMLRNLATMTRVGLLTEDSEATRHVVAELTNAERLKKARVHPLAVLVALKTYESGKGAKGHGEWTPVRAIVAALNAAFDLSFQAVEPTGKRWLLALDVSGSMGGGTVAGVAGISPRVAAAAAAMVTARTEASHRIIAFSEGIVPLDIRPGMTLDEVLQRTDGLPFDATDCAQPMLHALKNDLQIDAFVVYTDSETWFGDIHPFQALKEYREKTGIPAKLIVVGMVSNGFTIADPTDAGMMDVVGFDTSAPAVIADFARY
jgi:60 kDa SS-A/Ro ribonucleoprotein